MTNENQTDGKTSTESIGVTEMQSKFKNFEVRVILNLGYSKEEAKNSITNLVRMGLGKEMPSEQIGEIKINEASTSELQEVIPTSKAWFYALKSEVEALTNESVDEDEFMTFLDQQCYEIDDALQSAWENWKEAN